MAIKKSGLKTVLTLCGLIAAASTVYSQEDNHFRKYDQRTGDTLYYNSSGELLGGRKTDGTRYTFPQSTEPQLSIYQIEESIDSILQTIDNIKKDNTLNNDELLYMSKIGRAHV
jgi:hypothetical protein